MHGPYTAHIKIENEDPIILSESELREGSRIAERFYQDATPALVEGALRSAVFTAAMLLDRGQDAVVEVYGYVGSKGPIRVKEDRARRDEIGRFASTLGSRFNERIFRGI